MIGIGFIISTWVCYGAAQTPTSFSWRFPLAFQTVPCVIIILALLVYPESPRYLIDKGREEQALEVVKKPNSVEDMTKLTDEAPKTTL
jgi:MFS family permease